MSSIDSILNLTAFHKRTRSWYTACFWVLQNSNKEFRK